MATYINLKEAPIVAAAVKAEVDYLVKMASFGSRSLFLARMTMLARKLFDYSKPAPLPQNPQYLVMHHRHQLFVDVRSHDREYFPQQTSMRITPYHQALTCSEGRTYRLHTWR